LRATYRRLQIREPKVVTENVMPVAHLSHTLVPEQM
jgi:hypothetical protein